MDIKTYQTALDAVGTLRYYCEEMMDNLKYLNVAGDELEKIKLALTLIINKVNRIDEVKIEEISDHIDMNAINEMIGRK